MWSNSMWYVSKVYNASLWLSRVLLDQDSRRWNRRPNLGTKLSRQWRWVPATDAEYRSKVPHLCGTNAMAEGARPKPPRGLPPSRGLPPAVWAPCGETAGYRCDAVGSAVASTWKPPQRHESALHMRFFRYHVAAMQSISMHRPRHAPGGAPATNLGGHTGQLAASSIGACSRSSTHLSRSCTPQRIKSAAAAYLVDVLASHDATILLLSFSPSLVDLG
jgi:hypothetical protein